MAQSKSVIDEAFPGDIIFDRSSDQMYFVESYGSIYRSLSNDGPLKFQEIPGKMVTPGPPGSYDDLGDVALTFLLPSVLKTTSIMRNTSNYHLRLGDDDDNKLSNSLISSIFLSLVLISSTTIGVVDSELATVDFFTVILPSFLTFVLLFLLPPCIYKFLLEVMVFLHKLPLK